jgi:hypothetical protein
MRSDHISEMIYNSPDFHYTGEKLWYFFPQLFSELRFFFFGGGFSQCNNSVAFTFILTHTALNLFYSLKHDI